MVRKKEHNVRQCYKIVTVHADNRLPKRPVPDAVRAARQHRQTGVAVRMVPTTVATTVRMAVRVDRIALQQMRLRAGRIRTAGSDAQRAGARVGLVHGRHVQQTVEDGLFLLFDDAFGGGFCVICSCVCMFLVDNDVCCCCGCRQVSM